MAINLQKGQRVDLKKSSGKALKNVMIGLGWDPVERARGLKGLLTSNIDCDASAMLLENGRFVSHKDVVCFHNLRHRSGCVQHMGDNLTGDGDGDDEEIRIDLSRVPDQYDRIVIFVNIYMAKQRHQDFGGIKNAFMRIVDADTNEELLRYDLSGGDYNGKTAVIFGELYKKDGQWKLQAVGEGTTDNSIDSIAQHYQ